MNTKIIGRYTFALLIALAIGSNAGARRGGPGGKSVIHKKMMKELDLSAEQKDREANKEQRKGLKESMHQAIVDLNEGEMRKAHKQFKLPPLIADTKR
ncbi:MAG: hypothetical protein AB8E15_05345 [Bdellovibrionales bacterium]